MWKKRDKWGKKPLRTKTKTRQQLEGKNKQTRQEKSFNGKLVVK